MNLHGIVAGHIGAINPFVLTTVMRSAGYTTDASGKRTPTYNSVFNVLVQAQALQYNDIQQVNEQNIQGVRRAVYLSGEVEGVVRVQKEGGDLLVFPQGTFPEGNTWLAAFVFEAWPDWRKICITLQNQ